MSELLRRFKLDTRLTVELFIASLFANILALAMPIFVIQVLNRYIAHGVDITLATLTFGAVIALVLEFFFRQARLKLATGLSSNVDSEISELVFGSLIYSEKSELEKTASGQRQQCLNSLPSIQAAYNAVNISSVLDIPFALLFLATLFLLSTTLGFVATIFVCIALFVGTATMGSMRNPTKQSLEVSGQIIPISVTASREVDTIKAFNAGSFLIQRWNKHTFKLRELREQVFGRQGLFQSFMQASAGLVSVATIAVGGVLVVKGDLDIGTLIGANILAVRAIQPVFRFTQLVEVFVTAQQAVDKLRRIIILPRDKSEGYAKKNYQGNFEIKDAAFIYAGARTPLFESLSFSVNPGQTVFCIGENGTGKSTLARLMVGLVNPARGEVLLDGINLLQIAPEWWRRQIVFLPQEPVLLSATIRENIFINNPNMMDPKIQEIIDKVGLRKFVDESASGLDTSVTENGRNLSVGIKKRIALARAIATDGSLVILDEPTEGLDNEGMGVVGKVTRELYQAGKAVVIFSHDPKAMTGANLLIDLNSKPVPKVSRPKKIKADNN